MTEPVIPLLLKKSLGTLTLLLFSALLIACGQSNELSPEDQVKAVLSQMEQLIEERNTSDLFEHVSDHYQDHKGNDKTALRRFAQIFMIKNQSISMVTSIKSLDLIDPSTAAIEAVVVMAGRANNSDNLLAQLSADKQPVSAVFQNEDGEWRLTSMSWQYQSQY